MSITFIWQMDQAVFTYNNYSDGMPAPNAWISIYKELIALHSILLLVCTMLLDTLAIVVYI